MLDFWNVEYFRLGSGICSIATHGASEDRWP